MGEHKSARKLTMVLLVGIGMVVLITIFALMFVTLVVPYIGSIDQLHDWRQSNYWLLLSWRVALYAALIIYWLKLKSKLPEFKQNAIRIKVVKIEVLAVLLIVFLELTKAPLKWTDIL